MNFQGDIWVLAGQSNMEGYGLLEDVEPPSPAVFSYGMDERWQVATEPLNILAHSIDAVHNPVSPVEREAAVARGSAGMTVGAGLGLAFGKFVSDAIGEPIRLLPCAHGGTSLDEWSPSLRDRGGDSLYGSLMRRIEAVGGDVRGLLWYQGESDADVGSAGAYAAKWRAWVEAVRRDVGKPDLPVVWAQLGKVVQPEPCPGWNIVQQAQRTVEIPHTAVAPTIDLPMVDEIHIATSGLRRLGRRMGKMALGLAYGVDRWSRGPRLQAAEVDGQNIHVRFAEVNGRLVADGPVKGFSLTDPQSRLLSVSLTAKSLHPSPPPQVEEGAKISLAASGPIPPDARLWYGHGAWPECNLTDEEDMGCLTFGPIAI